MIHPTRFHGGTPRAAARIALAGMLAAAMAIGATLDAPALAAERPAGDGPAAAASDERLGRSIDEFVLRDAGGKRHALADYRDQRLVVVAFLGVECPLVRLYAGRLNALADEFAPRGVAFLGINSNRQDALEKLAAFTRQHAIAFPLLKDVGNQVADRFGARRTPEVFVLDEQRVIRYVGRIDDQYGIDRQISYQRSAPTRRDLADALDELLAGRTVSVPCTDAPGCLIGRVRTPDDDSPVTYSRDIAAIFRTRCEGCHRPGQIGPFVMQTYDDVLGWGEMIGEVVAERRMPPWHANPVHGDFINDARLSDDEMRLISEWVAHGCPEGDPAELPPPAEFVEGWAIGEPDEVVYMSTEPYRVPAEGVVPYRNFVVDPGWTEDRWIKSAEARPGNPAVVHHILVFIEPPGAPRRPSAVMTSHLIAGFAPGANPTFDCPDGSTAGLIKAGSRIRFQVHYTPNGSPQEDLSFLGVSFARPEEVEFQASSGLAINIGFRIPPGADDYEATARRTFRRDTLLLSLTPHMHLRGKAFRYEVQYPDGSSEVLLDIPRYDFNWQTTYRFREPKWMPAGTRLRCEARWDNSAENLANPDPSQAVTFGEQTWDEMMIGFFVEAVPHDGL